MNAVAHADLAAAVSNAGGLGVIGGLTFKPKRLRAELQEVRAKLNNPEEFMVGVDLAIPQIGDGARKTNHDYTEGHLSELVDIMVEEKIKLFVRWTSALLLTCWDTEYHACTQITHPLIHPFTRPLCRLGHASLDSPYQPTLCIAHHPQWLIDKMHSAGIPVMNMVGSPRNAEKALDAGVDIICAQGTEGGGHTGEIGTAVLIPQVVDLCRGRLSRLTGKEVPVVAAGGIVDGRGLAMALALGAAGVWVSGPLLVLKMVVH